MTPTKLRHLELATERQCSFTSFCKEFCFIFNFKRVSAVYKKGNKEPSKMMEENSKFYKAKVINIIACKRTGKYRQKQY
jgi:hypothetical protein